MLEKVKLSMRIMHSKLDNDIQLLIDSCLKDLLNVDVNTNSMQDDPLIITACILYCKWMSDFNNKGEQYENAYTNLKIALSCCGDYDV